MGCSIRFLLSRISLCILFGVFLLSFQNCSLQNFEIGKYSANSTLASTSIFNNSENISTESGNGGVYDGKLIGFHRVVPGYTCAGEKAAYAELEIKSDSAILTSGCDQKSEVPFADLEFAKLSNNYIGYKDGLYNYTNDLQADLAKNSFTEAWCQHLKGASDVDDFEIGIHWQQVGNQALTMFYTSKEVPPSESSAYRTMEVDHVRYTTSSFELQIQFLLRLPGSEKFPGHYRKYKNGILTDVAVECRLGGQFDPVAPQLSFSENFKTLALGASVTDLKPFINKSAAKFSVAPELPAGLNFNKASGEISGQPSALSIRKTYQVTAVFDFGEVTRAISLGVGQIFNIDGNCSAAGPSETCGLTEAITKANALAPLPSIIALKSASQQEFSREFSITGDVEIRGAGSAFDARELSRHFSVKTGATLSLKDLILKNGRADFGGSIAAGKESFLHISHVVFEKNKATAQMDGQGGAINIRGGKLSVIDSQFNNNSTPQNGGNLFGGAIYASGGEGIRILRTDFDGNISASGGAVFIESQNEVCEISDVRVSNGKALLGAGIYLRFGQFSIKDSNFESNASLLRGGGLFTELTDRVWVEKSRFAKNSAKAGSAIYYYAYKTDWAQFYLVDSELRENELDLMSLTYFSQSAQGSALNFSGPIRMHNTKIINSSPMMSNCSQIFTRDSISIQSLGGNIFDDKTCE
jgi:hypothetical protein